MTPAPIAQPAPASPSPPIQQPTPTRTPRHFDDIFQDKFTRIIVNWKENPSRGQLTQLDRKEFIETAYTETDLDYFGKRQLSDIEIKLRALTKVFYKVLAEEPWKEDWLRAPDVERKLSKFEMHKDSVALAAHYGLSTPKDAIIAAREALIKQQEAMTPKSEGEDQESKDQKIELGPFDDIEIIYIAGTVSSTATNKIDRENIYPVSVSSVANVLQNHICREMIRPFTMAEKLVHCTDTKELEKLRKFACDVCDFCPHLLDNDNVTLLVVLLILSRSDCCRRFEANGIRIEGSTISHRKAECMKNKMGWKTAEEKKPFDNFANEFQVRVKNACFPVSRNARSGPKKPSRKSSTPATPGTPSGMYPPPHMGYMAPPQVHPNAYHVNSGINIPTPSVHPVYSQQSVQQQHPQHQQSPHPPVPSYSRASSGVGSATEPMDLS